MYQIPDYIEDFESVYEDNDLQESFRGVGSRGGGGGIGSRGDLMNNPGISRGHVSKSSYPSSPSINRPTVARNSHKSSSGGKHIVRSPIKTIDVASKINDTKIKEINNKFIDDSGSSKLKKNLNTFIDSSIVRHRDRKNHDDDDIINKNKTIIKNRNYINNYGNDYYDGYYDRYPNRYYNGYSVPYWYYLNYPMTYYPIYYNLYNQLYSQYEEKASETNTELSKDIIDEYIKLKVDKILGEILSEGSEENKLEKFSSAAILSENIGEYSSYTDSLIIIILFIVGVLIIYCSLKDTDML